MNNVLACTLMLSLFGCGSLEDYKSKDSNIMAALETYIIEDTHQQNEQELSRNISFIRSAENNLNKESVIEACKKLVISKVLKKKTVSFNDNLRGNYYINQNTGDIYLYLEFYIENELGIAQELRGKCLFSMDGQSEVNIYE